jgi:hypothetical protein
MRTKYAAIISVLCLSGSIAACNPGPTPEVQPAQTGSESFVSSGAYELHYNAFRTDQLSADMARSYGLERSKNKVLLNVTVLHKEAPGLGKPIDAAVTVNARNLNGQVKDLQLRRIAEGDAIYYIGTAGISGSEILVFDISAVPSGEATPIAASLKREFFSD